MRFLMPLTVGVVLATPLALFSEEGVSISLLKERVVSAQRTMDALLTKSDLDEGDYPRLAELWKIIFETGTLVWQQETAAIRQTPDRTIEFSMPFLTDAMVVTPWGSQEVASSFCTSEDFFDGESVRMLCDYSSQRNLVSCTIFVKLLRDKTEHPLSMPGPIQSIEKLSSLLNLSAPQQAELRRCQEQWDKHTEPVRHAFLKFKTSGFTDEKARDQILHALLERRSTCTDPHGVYMDVLTPRQRETLRRLGHLVGGGLSGGTASKHGKVTLLFGANACTKSRVLQGLRLRFQSVGALTWEESLGSDVEEMTFQVQSETGEAGILHEVAKLLGSEVTVSGNTYHLRRAKPTGP